MKPSNSIDIGMLRRLVDYDPKTGNFTWLVRTPAMFEDGNNTKEHRCRIFNSNYAGKIAGGYHNRGYRTILLDGVRILSHRAAWAHFYGVWPDGEIDHIDCNKLNNRINNLREATKSENQRNIKTPRHNSSGIKGVSYIKRDDKWLASIKVNGVQKRIGSFFSKEEAQAAYCEAAKKYHGEFARVR